MKPKLTAWFPGDIKPVREGVYERRPWVAEYPLETHWNGEYWNYGSAGPARTQDAPWRGLASDPSAAIRKGTEA